MVTLAQSRRLFQNRYLKCHVRNFFSTTAYCGGNVCPAGVEGATNTKLQTWGDRAVMCEAVKMTHKDLNKNATGPGERSSLVPEMRNGL